MPLTEEELINHGNEVRQQLSWINQKRVGVGQEPLTENEVQKKLGVEYLFDVNLGDLDQFRPERTFGMASRDVGVSALKAIPRLAASVLAAAEPVGQLAEMPFQGVPSPTDLSKPEKWQLGSRLLHALSKGDIEREQALADLGYKGPGVGQKITQGTIDTLPAMGAVIATKNPALARFAAPAIFGAQGFGQGVDQNANSGGEMPFIPIAAGGANAVGALLSIPAAKLANKIPNGTKLVGRVASGASKQIVEQGASGIGQQVLSAGAQKIAGDSDLAKELLTAEGMAEGVLPFVIGGAVLGGGAGIRKPKPIDRAGLARMLRGIPDKKQVGNIDGILHPETQESLPPVVDGMGAVLPQMPGVEDLAPIAAIDGGASQIAAKIQENEAKRQAAAVVQDSLKPVPEGVQGNLFEDPALQAALQHLQPVTEDSSATGKQDLQVAPTSRENRQVGNQETTQLPIAEQALGGPRGEPAAGGFDKYLAMAGMTAERHAELSALEGDLVPQPEGELVAIRPSAIHGTGVFTKGTIAKGEKVATGFDDQWKRTPAARYVNHSEAPNSSLKRGPGKSLDIVAKRDLAPNEEVTMDYAQADKASGMSSLWKGNYVPPSGGVDGRAVEGAGAAQGATAALDSVPVPGAGISTGGDPAISGPGTLAPAPTAKKGRSRDVELYRLPKHLQKAAPRYQDRTLVFSSDFDRAAYIVANTKTKSKGEEKILASLKAIGLAPEEVRVHGAKVKESVKRAAEKGGTGDMAVWKTPWDGSANVESARKPAAPETKAPVAPGDVGVSPKTAQGTRDAANGTEGQAEVGSGLPGPTVVEKNVVGGESAPLHSQNRVPEGFAPIRADQIPEGYNTKGKDDPESQRFVLSSEGSVNWGAISTEISKEIGRQSGPIRLQIGWHGGPGKGFGLVHLQLGNKKTGRDLDLLAETIRNYDEIRVSGGRLVLIKNGDKTHDATIVELVPGDHYSIITSMGATKNQIEGWNPLWIRSRYPNHAPRSEASGLSDSTAIDRSGPPVADQQSVLSESDSLKTPEKSNIENRPKVKPNESPDQNPVRSPVDGNPGNKTDTTVPKPDGPLLSPRRTPGEEQKAEKTNPEAIKAAQKVLVSAKTGGIELEFGSDPAAVKFDPLTGRVTVDPRAIVSDNIVATAAKMRESGAILEGKSVQVKTESGAIHTVEAKTAVAHLANLRRRARLLIGCLG